jgi:retinol dehydrogenase 12
MASPNLDGKVVLVTGANTGIGKESARALAAMGATVIVHARSREKGEAAVAEIRATTGSDAVHLALADLASLEAVRALAAEILAAYDRLDVLLNNAGLMLSKRTETEDGCETTFAVNHLAPFLLTHLLLDRLKATAAAAGGAPGSARVVTVASEAHRRGGPLDFDDLQSARRYEKQGLGPYGRSKLCNILFTRALARRLEGTGVTANCCHPGVVRTEFAGPDDASWPVYLGWKLISPFIIGPVEGAATSIFLASSEAAAGQSGAYFIRCKPARPNAAGRDDAAAERLWQASEILVGLDPNPSRKETAHAP